MNFQPHLKIRKLTVFLKLKFKAPFLNLLYHLELFLPNYALLLERVVYKNPGFMAREFHIFKASDPPKPKILGSSLSSVPYSPVTALLFRQRIFHPATTHIIMHQFCRLLLFHTDPIGGFNYTVPRFSKRSPTSALSLLVL